MQAIEEFKSEQAEAIGARNEMLRTLKEKFGVSTLEEAKAKAEELKSRQRVLTKKRDEEYAKLKADPVWKKKLADSDE